MIPIAIPVNFCGKDFTFDAISQNSIIPITRIKRNKKINVRLLKAIAVINIITNAIPEKLLTERSFNFLLNFQIL